MIKSERIFKRLKKRRNKFLANLKLINKYNNIYLYNIILFNYFCFKTYKI